MENQKLQMENLHPSSVWLFFLSFLLKALSWGGLLGVAAFILVSQLYAMIFSKVDVGEIQTLYQNFLLYIAGFMVFVIIIAFIWARLFYSSFRFQLSGDSYRAEWGVIWKRYVSIPYERIQNIDITRGILDRLLGLSHLHIQTAGYGAAGARGGGSEGSLPGLDVARAEELRDELIRRAKGSRQDM